MRSQFVAQYPYHTSRTAVLRPVHGPAPHHPAQGRITPQPVGIIDVLVSSEPPEHRLVQLSNQRVTAILARPGVGKNLFGQVCQAEDLIEVSKGEHTNVGRHSRTMEFQLQVRIESDPESGIVFFTRCTVHLQPR